MSPFDGCVCTCMCVLWLSHQPAKSQDKAISLTQQNWGCSIPPHSDGCFVSLKNGHCVSICQPSNLLHYANNAGLIVDSKASLSSVAWFKVHFHLNIWYCPLSGVALTTARRDDSACASKSVCQCQKVEKKCSCRRLYVRCHKWYMSHIFCPGCQ